MDFKYSNKTNITPLKDNHEHHSRNKIDLGLYIIAMPLEFHWLQRTFAHLTQHIFKANATYSKCCCWQDWLEKFEIADDAFQENHIWWHHCFIYSIKYYPKLYRAVLEIHKHRNNFIRKMISYELTEYGIPILDTHVTRNSLQLSLKPCQWPEIECPPTY